jgi:hypothetical protein
MSVPASTHIVWEKNKTDGKNSGNIEMGEERVVVPVSAATATTLVYTTTDDAVDDSEDLPDDLVRIQKTISGERRLQQNRPKPGIQDLLPFPFSPLIRPLTVSDLESCVALENAAFANPAHRCTRDKVSMPCI